MNNLSIYSKTEFQNTFDSQIIEKAKKVKLIISDVDGVLTDGSIYKGDDNKGENIESQDSTDSDSKEEE